MPVFRWGENWDPFRDLEREVDRLLQGVNLSFEGLRVGRRYPLVNLYELDHEYLLTAEVPGVNVDDLEITVAGGILSLKGSRETPEDVPEESFRRHERFRGTWQRSISLPDRVNEADMSAEFSNGILQVHLPKLARVEPRQIPVVEGAD